MGKLVYDYIFPLLVATPKIKEHYILFNYFNVFKKEVQ